MEERLWSRRDVLKFGGAYGLAALGLPPRGGLLPSDYRTLVLRGKPAAYWRLGERRGTTAHGELGRGHDGRTHGGVAWGAQGAISRDDSTALGLNGQDAYVEIPSNEHFSQAGSGMGLTVEAWMRPDRLDFDGETSEHYVHWLGKGETGAFEWGMRFYSRHSSRPNRISAYLWNPDGGLGAGAYFEEEVRPGEWIHVVACYDPGDATDPNAGVSIYRNGRLRGSPQTQKGARYSSYNIASVPGSAPVRLGTRDRGSFFAGALDEVAIYPRVLTAAEIGSHYWVATHR